MAAPKDGSVDPPATGHVARLRAAMLRAVSEEDIEVIMTQLCYLAKQGNVMAAREVLDRCLGSGFNPTKIEELPRATGGVATARPASDRPAALVPLPEHMQGERREIPGDRRIRGVVLTPIYPDGRRTPRVGEVYVATDPAPTQKPARPGGSPFD